MATDVLIVGGGIAGLAAALHLSRSGLKVEILEARDRVGGRIYTIYDPFLNYPIELGAEFVHGFAAEIWEPLQNHGVPLREVSGELWCVREDGLQPCDFFAESDEILAEMSERDPDESFLDFLARRFPGPQYDEAKQWATGYVSGFNAADPGDVSVHWLAHNRRADEQISGDRAFRISGGYHKLIDLFTAELASRHVSIHLRTVVREVRWNNREVEIGTASSSSKTEFRAATAVVTLPLGVLKSESVVFTPPLPNEKRSALDQLEMGRVIRLTLRFREPFWTTISPPGEKSLAGLSFIFSHDDTFPTWWTQSPEPVPVITGWAPAGSAEKLAGMDQIRIVQKSIECLASLLGVERRQVESQLVASSCHDWDSDPFSCGAYSYAKVGGEGSQQSLGRPLDHTLFFAGEATDTGGHNGTVHGAITSGRRAAQEILADW